MNTLDDAIRMIDCGRVEEGVHLLRTIASGGDPRGLYLLAHITWSGTHVAQDPQRGRLLFEYAAARGHGQANLFATNLVATGVAGRRDWSLALSRLEDEARQVPARRRTLALIAAMDIDANGDPRSTPEPTPLAERPYVRVFDRLLTPEECGYLIEATGDSFEPSMVYNRERELVRDTIRTSDGATFHWLIEDPAVHALNRRIASATGTSFDQGEALQVLRYSPGQQYRPHFDFVPDAQNQRLWTALIYLNEDYEGGETQFVETGLTFRGRTGDVLLFRNALPDGSIDDAARHAGLPVNSGTKYLATRWVRERRWIP
ncbi:MAG TPA: 2OG-Fe(II) oxygenase [Sphingomicrobium sp.]|nr:2OG-Fe(II) oxygenase [Sphingomicrobium sp.]